MPISTKTKDFKVENVSYDKSDFPETDDGKKYSKHYFSYKHNKNGGTVKAAGRFKADFDIRFTSGLVIENGESKYPKLQGRAELDLSDPKVRSFVDSPDLGQKSGWVRETDVEMTGFNTFKSIKDIPYFNDPSDEKEEDMKGTIPKGTVLNSDQKDEEFFHVSFGGGEEGMLYKLRKGVAKQLYKNRKAAGLKNFKSEKELEKAIKFPVYFSTDEDGNPTDRASWYIKVTYRGGKDGYMAKFEVPGVRELTLDELLNNSITGRPCFTFSNVYQGGGKYSMQIFLSSFVVTDFAPIVYSSVQQDEIDEYANDPEFVARMKKLIPDKPLPPVKKKESKEPKKNEKDSSKSVKDFLAPTLTKVEDDESEDSDDEVVAGVPEKKKQPETDSDDSDDEVVPEKKKQPETDSDDSDDD